MIETWDDLLELLRQNGVPGTTLSHDTLRMLDAVTEAASRPVGREPHRTVRNAAENRLRELGIMSSVTAAATQPHRAVRDVVESRMQMLAQPVARLNAAGDRETRWCVPVAPLTGTVHADDFAVCGAQHAAWWMH